MKKIIKLALLVCLIFADLAASGSKKYSQKNFMAPRDQLTNLAMRHVSWHLYFDKKADGRYSGTVQAVPFFQESTNKSGLGRYFGFYNSAKDRYQNYIGVDPNNTDGDYLLKTDDIIHNIRYDEYDEANTLSARVGIDPYQQVYGVRLDWHQDLDDLWNGLFFRVSTPIVWVRNDINLFDKKSGSQRLPRYNGTFYTLSGPEITLRDFFNGNLENFNTDNRQLPLKYAKMGTSHTAGGFADFEVALGYQVLYRRDYHLVLNALAVIPTGNVPHAEYRFEPIYGNGGHWGIGAGLDADLILWRKSDDKYKFKVLFAADYKYLFPATEKRTPTIKGYDGVSKLEYIYVLAGEKGKKYVFPLANVLTQDLNVHPGSIFDAIVAFNFKISNWDIDLGYNIFFKECENVYLKKAWDNYKYAVAAYGYNASAEFNIFENTDTRFLGIAQTPDNELDRTIKEKDIDLKSVSQPSQTTHKIYGGVSYNYTKWEHPLLFGLGGSYEWASTNAALEGWAIWFKTAISF